MSEAISITSAHTEALTADTRAAIIQVCRSAHQEDDFLHLFSYIPSGGLHVLASRAHVVVSHAVATTRWLQPKATLDGLVQVDDGAVAAYQEPPPDMGTGFAEHDA